MNWNPPGTPKPPKKIYHLKRTPIKKNPNYHIPKISKKKAKQLREERPIRKALQERANGICEKCHKRREVHPHEEISQARGGRVSMKSKMLCNFCHMEEQGNVLGLKHQNIS